ncbi:MAG: hypothetical protein OK454_03650 [Thaumarchaeota archaeon]|nr:hypothetical protein [Nitrososphaerota archaeon]
MNDKDKKEKDTTPSVSIRRTWHITIPSGEISIETSSHDPNNLDFLDSTSEDEPILLSLSWEDFELLYLNAKAERERFAGIKENT